MRFLILTLLALSASLAHAQHQGESLWLNVDYTYSQFVYTDATFAEKGAMSGVRGDVGLGLIDNFGMSVGGEYRDGNLNYDGATYTNTSYKAITADYMRDTYALAHFMFGPITISGGVAQKEWLNHISGAYRRRMFADYYPASIMLARSSFYIKAETYVNKDGHTKIYMSDTGTGATDVDVMQKTGSGFGAELGFELPNMLHIRDHMFVAYKKWNVDASETKSDGEQQIQVGKYTIEIWQAGLGFSF